MCYYQLNKLNVRHLWPLWEKVSLWIRIHMASHCYCYRFKIFCYYGIGAIAIHAYTQMFFAKIHGTCKYDTTSNCITLLQIIEYINIINRWYMLDIFTWVNMYYLILKTNKMYAYILLLIIYIICGHII